MQALNLRVAWRRVRRQKAFASINIVGLALGMAACLLIVLFVRDELSYDTHLDEVDRLYRVTYHSTTGSDYARVPPPIGPRMPEFFNEVEESARAFSGNMSLAVPSVLSGQADATFEENVWFVDSTFADLFPMDVVQGIAPSRAMEPFQLWINEEVAERFFGEANPVGRTVQMSGDYTYTVMGVVRDFPPNTHLHIDALAPYDDMFKVMGEQTGTFMQNNLSQNWVISHSYTYARLHPGADPEAVNARFAELIDTQAPEQLRLGQSFSLMPVADIHLHSQAFLEPEPQGNMRNIYLFSIIAALTLLLPCFNFINLATAQSMGRTAEVGVRKAIGAQRSELFRQFLSESMWIVGAAFVLAIGLVLVGLPYLNTLTQKELSALALFDPMILGGALIIYLLTSLLGGSYPAWLIAKTNIVTALRGRVSEVMGRRFTLRRVLVVMQFAISLILLAGTFLIFKQISFLTSQSLGYQPEGVVAVPLYSTNMNNLFTGVDGEMRSRLNTLEAQLADVPGVTGTTLSRSALGLGAVARGTSYEDQVGEDRIFVPAMAVDYDYLDVYGVELVAGRSFDQARGTDHTDAFIVNETAVQQFGWGSPEAALGKSIDLEGKQGAVIGVVKDFNYTSLRRGVQPALFEVNVPAFRTLSVKIAASNLTETLKQVEAAWAEVFPERTFTSVFVDQQLANQYQNEQRLGQLVRAFAVLAIIVSCLGAYGLVLFNVRRRQREIGVRKVLGASLSNVLGLLYREMTILFGLGVLVAIPVVYVFGQQWLDDFAYRTGVGADIFVWSTLVLLVLAAVTVSYQSLRAARLNPVDCLRDD
ncbi:MAG: ABC transporter permease [Rhodothermales bacterium]